MESGAWSLSREKSITLVIGAGVLLCILPLLPPSSLLSSSPGLLVGGVLLPPGLLVGVAAQVGGMRLASRRYTRGVIMLENASAVSITSKTSTSQFCRVNDN